MHQKSRCWVLRKYPLLLCTAHFFNALLVVQQHVDDPAPRAFLRGRQWRREARSHVRATAPPPPTRYAFEMPDLLRRCHAPHAAASAPRRAPSGRPDGQCTSRDLLEPGRPTRRAVPRHALARLLEVVRDPHQRRRIDRPGAACDLGRFRQIVRLHETSEKQASHAHTANGSRYLGATSAVRRARDHWC